MDNFFHEEKNDEITTWDENERKRLPTLNYLLDEILYGYGFSYVHPAPNLAFADDAGASSAKAKFLADDGVDSWKTLTGFACTSCTPPAVRPEVSN